MDKKLWLVLYVYYKASSGFLKLNGKMVQRRIGINRGVKQGGILSPFLFNAFMDSLIVDCKALGIGAHWNELNVSILAYCDDVILIAPSLEQLRALINTANGFGQFWQLTFNRNKCVVMNAGYKLYDDDEIDVKIGDTRLQIVDKIEYLGLIFNDKSSYHIQALKKMSDVEGSFYSLNNFGIKPNGIQPSAKAFIYKNFCVAKLHYALSISSLNEKVVKQLDVKQNNLIRYTLGLTWKSHIADVLKAMDIMQIYQLHQTQQLITTRLLHRHPITKHILIDSVSSNYCYKNSFALDINTLSKSLSTTTQKLTSYPDIFIKII